MSIDTLEISGEVTSDNPMLIALVRIAIAEGEKQKTKEFGPTLGIDPSFTEVMGIMKDTDHALVVAAGVAAVKQCIEDVKRAQLAERPRLMRDDTL